MLSLRTAFNEIGRGYTKARNRQELNANRVTSSETAVHYSNIFPIDELDSSKIQLAFSTNLRPEFISAVIKEFKKFLPFVLAFLKDKEIKTLVGVLQDEISPQDAETHWDSQRDDFRVHQNEAGGSYRHSVKRVSLSQCYYSGYSIPCVGDRPSEVVVDVSPSESPMPVFRFSEDAKNWHLRQIDKVVGVLRHEIGHAVSANEGENGIRLSATDDFRAAYRDDIKCLGGESAVRQAGLGYYVQSLDQGPEEVFAECFGSHMGGGCRGTKILEQFPACTVYVQKIIQNMEAKNTTFSDDCFFSFDQPILFTPKEIELAPANPRICRFGEQKFGQSRTRQSSCSA